jgi:aspartate-semialdehyde dehydrogenase
MSQGKDLKPPLRVGILGATGLVGRRMVEDLASSRVDVESVLLWATDRGAGTEIPFRGRPQVVEDWGRGHPLDGVDALLLATDASVSREVAPSAAEHALVIDNSSAFRMDPDVPLVVPEVNGDAAASHRGIIANPNCSTIQLVMALAPLQRAVGLERVIVSTYQAVSGMGRDGVRALESEESGEDASASPFPKTIHRNVIPQCDTFVEGGWTREEWKMKVETRKILGAPELSVEATCVRVPVSAGHSEAVTVDLSEPLRPSEARRLWESAPGVILDDNPALGAYPVPLAAEGRPEVFIGRIRSLPDRPRTLFFWVVADNLTKGAATNAVQILEHVVGTSDA